DDVRHDVHHVTVSLNHHLLGDFDAPEFRNSPEIVAAQIDQHHMLSALFWIGNQLARELIVFGCIFSAAISSGNWPQLGDAVAHTQMYFGRASKDREIRIESQTKHVGRRVTEPERAIKIECLAAERRLESLGHDHLENITGCDQLFRFYYHPFEL